MKKNKMDTQEYQFIKETVKKQPKENGSLLRRLLMIVGCGVLFGGCAAVTFASVFPVMADREENTQQKIELTGSDVAETISEEQATERESVASVSEQEEKSLLAMRQEMYREVLKVSQKSRKSLVNVRGISKDEDLLNNSYLQKEDTEGLVFLETETQFYILTYEEELENLQELQVTFADGSTVQGEICRGDADSGFAVATVRKNLLNDSTREGIVVSDLTDTKKLGQSDIVIAIGSPAGDSDAVVYGMITSVSEKLSVADTEYNVLATDVQGNEDGSGVLLDSDGNVAGMILKKNENDGDNIHAVSISQILPLVEHLANKETIRYTGIYGTEITQAQCRKLGIDQGLYVERTQEESPAMKAGIQCGDIISKIDGTPTESMQSYYTYLQTKKQGENLTITVLRKNSDGEYAEKDYKVTVGER